MKRFNNLVRATLTFVGLTLITQPALASNTDAGGWIATWATASSVQSPFDAPTPTFNDTTLREIVRVTIGGFFHRVWLTNEHGTEPLVIGAAELALRDMHSAILPGTSRTLTFSGNPSITIPPGARVLSDAVSLKVPARSDLAISIHLPQDLSAQTSPASYHVRALQTSYMAHGNQTAEDDLSGAESITSWFYLAGVESRSGYRTALIAALGDSTTDGDQLASMPPVDQQARYTDFLGNVLIQTPSVDRFDQASVVNLGISGNQLLSTFIGNSMVARLNRDVLTLTGITHVILLGGINDLGLPVLLGAPNGASAEMLIAGQRQIIQQARARGLKVIGGTITPAGSTFLPGYNSPETDAIRQEVNAWIRTSGEFDAVADFDKALRDSNDPSVMRADVTADGLHPNTEGYRLMAFEARRAFERSEL